MERVDPGTFRDVMGRFPTGVTVVGTRAPDGSPRGLTVNAFTSVSLDPPLVLVCIDRGSSSHDILAEGEGFAVSILSDTQSRIAAHFASEPSEERFEGIDWDPADSGNPVLSGASAWLDCALADVLEGGDHSILLGRVVSCGTSDAAPLLFHAGSFGSAVP